MNMQRNVGECCDWLRLNSEHCEMGMRSGGEGWSDRTDVRVNIGRPVKVKKAACKYMTPTSLQVSRQEPGESGRGSDVPEEDKLDSTLDRRNLAIAWGPDTYARKIECRVT